MLFSTWKILKYFIILCNLVHHVFHLSLCLYHHLYFEKLFSLIEESRITGDTDHQSISASPSPAVNMEYSLCIFCWLELFLISNFWKINSLWTLATFTLFVYLFCLFCFGSCFHPWLCALPFISCTCFKPWCMWGPCK